MRRIDETCSCITGLLRKIGAPLRLALIVISLLCWRSSAFSGDDPAPAGIRKRIEDVLSKHLIATGTPGIAFGLVRRDLTIADSYLGYASVEDKRLVDASTLFDWGSLSKSLTAVCALKMAETDVLDLDADIRSYLPELELDTAVSCRHILAHQAGIGGLEVYPQLFELERFSREELSQKVILDRIRVGRTIFPPGTRQEYSSPGYILLSIAMERAAKKSFDRIVDEIVATPLGLSSLCVGGTSKSDVSAYQLEHGKPQLIDNPARDWLLGAGAVRSNLGDAIAFVSSLTRSSLLSPKSSHELFKRRSVVKFELDQEGPLMSITYGFLRAGEGPAATIMSRGDRPGARSLLVIYPQTQVATIMFANASPLDLETINLEVMKSLMEK